MRIKNASKTNDNIRIKYVRFQSTKGAIVSNGKDTIILLNKSIKYTPEKEKVINKLLKKMEAWKDG